MLKANQATIYTVTEVDGNFALKANVSDVDAALALKADKIYVDGQLVLKANQDTTYTKSEVNNLLAPKTTTSYVDIELDKNANLSETLIALSQKHPLLTASSDLTINRMYAKSIESPSGTANLQTRTHNAMFGITAYASRSSAKASFWVLVFIL